MVIYIICVQHNGGFLPDMILLTLSMSLALGNPIKCHEGILSFLSLQPMFLLTPKRFDKFRAHPKLDCVDGEKVNACLHMFV